MRKPKRLTKEETIAETNRLLLEGFSPFDIAKKMGLENVTTVYNWKNGKHTAPLELRKLGSKVQKLEA